jgi:divinyl protochlorophyllide a 8-vinyl-reductase
MTASATDHAPGHVEGRAGRQRRTVVGPNAVTRVAEALDAAHGRPVTAAVFAAAGLSRHLVSPPTAVVEEAEVAALHRALRGALAPGDAERVTAEAGRLTADYLLANRIPRPAQRLLRMLPRPLAARLLARAITRNAWTFAGSGRFSWRAEGGRALLFTVEGSPVCRHVVSDEPVCQTFAATFERIFAAVLGPSVRVRETACAATGAPACVFRLTW